MASEQLNRLIIKVHKHIDYLRRCAATDADPMGQRVTLQEAQEWEDAVCISDLKVPPAKR